MSAVAGALAELIASFRAAGDPSDPAALLAQLRLLHGIGRRDLALGRLFEGHVDAGQIVARYGEARQLAALPPGAALGVWNADLPGDALRLEDGLLHGGKAYASGAGVLSHALVTADTPSGRQLVLLELARTPPAIDRGWWQVIGMQRSETHLVRWHGAAVRPDDLVGRPGDYAREPWFSGGALRFVAVQAGGVAAILDRTRDHLVATGRAGDPLQSARLAELFRLAEGAAATVRDVADRWFAEPDAVRLPRVAAARLAVASAGERAVTVAGQAVGLAGMFDAHPLSAMLTDLTVYLRQPAPDAAAARVGGAVAAGLLVPEL